MKETLATNTHTKEALPAHPSVGKFGIGVFGTARFGTAASTFPKEALSANSATKEALPSVIT